MKFRSLYLWQNKVDQQNRVISWCSQEQYGTIETDSIFADDYLSIDKITSLRDKTTSLSLKDLLGETIFSTFSDWLQALGNNDYLRIHLINTLPKSWQQLPLEWCQWQGEPLYKKIQLVRYAALPKTSLPVHHTEQTLILNLWPQVANHRKFFENIIYDPHFEVIQGRFKTILHIRNNDVSQLSLLCVIAHGNETDVDNPLLCEKLQAWSLPERQLPPLVLLIACGGEQGNLLLYGATLLERGAKTVLAAKGKLDASQVTDFLDAFLKHWKTGANAECILFQLQAENNAEHAARRIHVMGQSGLYHASHTCHKADISDWNSLTKVAANDNDALLMLLDQLTLHNLVTRSSLESSVNDLYDALQLDYNNPHEKRSLLYDRLETLYLHCLPLTQKWLSCFLMYLSSIHKNQAIDYYQQEVIRLQKIKTQGSDDLFFYMASGQYRSRQHEQAMKILIDGLNSLSSHQQVKHQYEHEADYKLKELALNIAIVMTLPELGLFFLEQSNDALASLTLDKEQRALETFTQFDRTARLFVRIGDPDNELKGDAGLIRCIYQLQQKRSLAITTRQETGERELCLLLYFSAWLKYETPNTDYCHQALILLASVDEISKELKSKTGNLTKLYLLRALSAWAWLQQDKKAIALLEAYLPTIIELCNNVQRHNTAPLGFIIAYMALLGHPLAKQQWFYIANKMLSDQCYFELALFHRLLKQDKKAIAAFKKHKQQQHRVFENMKALQQGVCMDEYQVLLQSTEERLASESVMDIVTMDLDTMQGLGFIPF